MKPTSASTSIAQRDSGTSEKVGARKPSTGRPARSSSSALPAGGVGAERGRVELGERLWRQPCNANSWPRAATSRTSSGCCLGGLADDEERAAHPACVEEVEHPAGERGIALLGVGRRAVVLEVEGERDQGFARHQYASMSRNSNVSSASDGLVDRRGQRAQDQVQRRRLEPARGLHAADGDAALNPAYTAYGARWNRHAAPIIVSAVPAR